VGGDQGVPIVASDPDSVPASALRLAAERVAFQVLITPAGRAMEV